MTTLPDLPRAEGVTIHDHVFARLRQAIMVGSLRPGQAVTIRGLAEALEASPTPVREALRQLTSIGALDLRENRRITVPLVTPDRFEELVALRIALERHAAERAMPHTTERQIDRLEEIDATIDAAIAAGDKTGALLANQSFHRAIYAANPDPVALPLIEGLWLQLGPLLGIAMEHVEELYAVDRHREIIAALRKRSSGDLADAITADIGEGIGGFDRAAIVRLVGLSGR